MTNRHGSCYFNYDIFQQIKTCPASPCTNADRNARGKAEDEEKERWGAAEGRPPPFLFCCAHPAPLRVFFFFFFIV